jgi:hypothetical protein
MQHAHFDGVSIGGTARKAQAKASTGKELSKSCHGFLYDWQDSLSCIPIRTGRFRLPGLGPLHLSQNG